jgi:SPOR domain
VSDDLSIPAPTYRMHRRSHGMDPGTKKLAIIAGGLGAGLLLVVGASHVIGHRGGVVPIVQPDPRPIRVKPDNPGGLQIAGTSEDIFGGDSGSDTGKLAPPPEAPAPQALRASAPAPARAPAAPVAQMAPPIAAPRPAIQSAPVSAPVVAPKPAVAVEKPVAETHPAVVASDKKALVQLAALGTEDAAKAEWARLEKRMPDVLGGHRPAVSKIERDGHTMWRLRTGGFADTAEATVFCERVRAKGAGCSVADF